MHLILSISDTFNLHKQASFDHARKYFGDIPNTRTSRRMGCILVTGYLAFECMGSGRILGL